MNQPPKLDAPAQWRRPPGVAPGTWDYVNQRAIADRYDAFVADTPLCRLDESILHKHFPSVGSETDCAVIDLGCGSGRAALPLSRRGYQVVGVDLSPAMLRVMRDKLIETEAGSTHDSGHRGAVHAVQASIVDLDCFGDQSIDHAVCLFATIGMVQGRENRRQMLTHVRRIVKPGGKFVLHAHNIMASLHEPGGKRAALKSLVKSLASNEHEFGDAYYAYRGLENMFMHRFTQSELKRDLSESGWQIDQWNLVSPDGSSLISSAGVLGSKAGGFIVVAS